MQDEKIVQMLNRIETSMNEFRNEFLDFKKEMIDFKKGTEDILDKHTKKHNQHTSALMKIENTLSIYDDMYNLNKDKLDKLEIRVVKLEQLNGIY